jgi:hypothetical protein
MVHPLRFSASSLLFILAALILLSLFVMGAMYAGHLLLSQSHHVAGAAGSQITRFDNEGVSHQIARFGNESVSHLH